MNNLILEKKAGEFRNANSIGANDAIRLKSLLSQLNVLTVYRPLSLNFGGMAIKINNGNDVKRFILVNSNRTIGNQHFTIGHELYHLYFQKEFASKICNIGVYDSKDKEECNADIFASYLLLPESGIKMLIPDNELGKNKILLNTILKIEHFFSCSRTALLYRLKQLNFIDSALYDTYKENVKRSALQFGYSIDLYESGNHNLVVGDYGTIARNLFEKEIISESNYFSLLLDLGINVDEIEKLGNEDD
ncbi:MAG: ImmA/IrrE family metallo-endopeptidase [Bacteroidetes bacterium]|nr:ImmA/IrrE family metallo-endopeptidase [Bacteroidota bacterium]